MRSLLSRIMSIKEEPFFSKQEANAESVRQEANPESKRQEAGAKDKENIQSNIEQEDETGPGPSPHIAKDKWTSDDSLGYRDYAHAIAKFLTHKRTSSPLSISIQAAWGGGKTSLMRMIQEELDSEAAGKLPKGNQFPLNEFQFKATVNDILRILDNLKKMAKKTKEEEKKSDVDKENKEENKFKIEQIKAGDASVAPRVTVWFNAWKYESTQQL